MGTTKKIIIGISLVTIVGGLVYWFGIRAGRKLPLPTSGNGIPEGWTPVIVVEQLRSAMDGVGTDENAVYNALEGLTDDQLAAVVNEYNHTTNEILKDRLREEFSGEELDRVLFIFKNVF